MNKQIICCGVIILHFHGLLYHDASDLGLSPYLLFKIDTIFLVNIRFSFKIIHLAHLEFGAVLNHRITPSFLFIEVSFAYLTIEGLKLTSRLQTLNIHSLIFWATTILTHPLEFYSNFMQ